MLGGGGDGEAGHFTGEEGEFWWEEGEFFEKEGEFDGEDTLITQKLEFS